MTFWGKKSEICFESLRYFYFVCKIPIFDNVFVKSTHGYPQNPAWIWNMTENV